MEKPEQTFWPTQYLNLQFMILFTANKCGKLVCMRWGLCKNVSLQMPMVLTLKGTSSLKSALLPLWWLHNTFILQPPFFQSELLWNLYLSCRPSFGAYFNLAMEKMRQNLIIFDYIHIEMCMLIFLITKWKLRKKYLWKLTDSWDYSHWSQFGDILERRFSQ